MWEVVNNVLKFEAYTIYEDNLKKRLKIQKDVIRSRKWKDRQQNVDKEKVQRDNK